MPETGILQSMERVELINGKIVKKVLSSLQCDREVKLPLYAEADLPENRIVNLQQQYIEISSPEEIIY